MKEFLEFKIKTYWKFFQNFNNFNLMILILINNMMPILYKIQMIFTVEIGKITKEMVMERIIIKMNLIMKVIGLTTSHMAKVEKQILKELFMRVILQKGQYS